MNETMVTLVGNVATAPVFREMPTGPVARFRLAVTPRRWDRTRQDWRDGRTSFFTVWSWRTLASNVSASVAVGEPVIVQGRLKVRDEERGGQHWTSVDIEALSVGHDLARGTSAFRRALKAGVTPWSALQGAGRQGEGTEGEGAQGEGGQGEGEQGGAIPVEGEPAQGALVPGPGAAGPVREPDWTAPVREPEWAATARSPARGSMPGPSLDPAPGPGLGAAVP